jgi:hypothetical protein
MNLYNLANLIFFQVLIILNAWKSRVPAHFFIVFLIISCSPFLFGSLISSSYMPDQSKYLEAIQALRINHFDPAYYPYTVAFSSIILFMVPTPFVVDTISIGLVNIFLFVYLFLTIYKVKEIPRYIKYIFLFYPSHIFYASLSLRDELIVVFVLLSFIFAARRYNLSSLFLIAPLLVIKFQVFFLVFPMLFLFMLLRQKVSWYVMPILIAVYTCMIYFSIDSLDFYRRAMWIDNRGNGLNYEELSGFLEFIILAPMGVLRFFFEPMHIESDNIWQAIQACENLLVSLVLVVTTCKNWKIDSRVTSIWLLFLIVSASIYGVVVDNSGTLSRYKFSIVLFYVVLSSYHARLCQISSRSL